jgi:hypothetical protein
MCRWTAGGSKDKRKYSKKERERKKERKVQEGSEAESIQPTITR